MATFAYPEQTQGAAPVSAPSPAAGASPVAESNPKATLWMGDLEPWMDQNYLRTTWYNMGEQVNVKTIFNRSTGTPANYCFIEFPEVNACSKALATYNGTYIPATQKIFRLNWATGNQPGGSPTAGPVDAHVAPEKPTDFPIFVGDLAPEVNDYLLLTTIQARFPSCHTANVKVDTRTGVSRGYGFARLTDEGEYQRALIELGGLQIGSRAIRVSTVTPSARRGPPNGYYPPAGPYGHYQAQGMPNGAMDPSNTTVFVGGLVQPVTENDLRQHFQSFGVITHIKIPQGKGCAFVQFQQHPQAEMAIAQLNGTQLASSTIRLSWGRGHNGNHNAGAQPYHPHPHHHHQQQQPPHYGRMNGNGYYQQHRGGHYPNANGGGFRPPHREPGQHMPMDGSNQPYPQEKDKNMEAMKNGNGFNSYGVQA